MEFDKQRHVIQVCTFVSLHAVSVYCWLCVTGTGTNGVLA